MDLDATAQECGWYGWSEGPGDEDFVVYKCGCIEDHLYTYVANNATDPDYYAIRCAYIRECRT
jgi:hypothetical protein